MKGNKKQRRRGSQGSVQISVLIRYVQRHKISEIALAKQQDIFHLNNSAMPMHYFVLTGSWNPQIVVPLKLLLISLAGAHMSGRDGLRTGIRASS